MFLHRLALALGRTVRELLQTLTLKELQQWIQFYNIDPWGDQRADWRAGQLCALTANMWRKKSDKALTPSDFMLKAETDEERAKRAEAETLAAFMNYDLATRKQEQK